MNYLSFLGRVFLSANLSMIPRYGEPLYPPQQAKTLEESVEMLAELALQCGELVEEVREGRINKDYFLPDAAPVREPYFILRDGPVDNPDGKAGERDLFAIGFGDENGFHAVLGDNWVEKLTPEQAYDARNAIERIHFALPRRCRSIERRKEF